MFRRISLKLKITIIVSLVMMTSVLLLTIFIVSLGFNSISSIPKEITSVSILPAETYDSIKIDDIDSNQNYVKSLTAIKVAKAKKNFGMEAVLVMFIISMFGVISIYFIIKKTMNPLYELTKTVENINENNLDIKIDIDNYDNDFIKLASSFNLMLERLRESFEIQKNFSYNAAHELKTPLSIMKSSIQVLNMEENPTEEDYRENNEIIYKNIEKLINIVNELLLISTKNNHNNVIYIDEIIDEVLEKNFNDINLKNISLYIDNEHFEIYSNKILVESIINNIVQNAIKYNKYNGSIYISLKKDNFNNKCVFTVKDTGEGINKEDLKYIFDAFYRVDKSRAKIVEGNGLGLYIVKNSAEKINAKINVSSCFGKETIFEVIFDLKNN